MQSTTHLTVLCSITSLKTIIAEIGKKRTPFFITICAAGVSGGMEINMISLELNRILVSKFPTLQEKYTDEVNWQEGDNTGSHTVYGDVLVPYLSECISKDYEQEIKTIFHFLEELLELDDKYVDEVVSFSVLESLAYLFKEKSYLISYLGEKCKKALDEVM